MKICLLGASFDTGNLGVSALAESSVKIILSRWPDAEITLQGNGSARGWQYLSLMGREIRIGTSPIRFSKNIFLQCHFLRFVLCGILTKVLPVRCLKKTLVSRNPYFKTLYEADIVASIDGGDSFSDIYGYKRFFWMFLRKWLVIFLGKKLILLPQTYGPFENRVVRTMAKYILKHATAIYARDCAGVEYVKHLLNNTDAEASFLPDVAFVLDSKKPENIDIGGLAEVKTEDTVVVSMAAIHKTICLV